MAVDDISLTDGACEEHDVHVTVPPTEPEPEPVETTVPPIEPPAEPIDPPKYPKLGM